MWVHECVLTQECPYHRERDGMRCVCVYAGAYCNISCCMDLNVHGHVHWGVYGSMLLSYTAYSYKQTSIGCSDELSWAWQLMLHLGWEPTEVSWYGNCWICPVWYWILMRLLHSFCNCKVEDCECNLVSIYTLFDKYWLYVRLLCFDCIAELQKSA